LFVGVTSDVCADVSEATFRASPSSWNSAKIWYAINKNANRTNADSRIFTRILLAFLKFPPDHPSVMYRYHATITIITIIIQYIYQNTFATFMIRSEAFLTNVFVSAVR
jgi:hypothetical protein